MERVLTAPACGEGRGDSPLTPRAENAHLSPMDTQTQTAPSNPLYPLTPQQVRALLAKLIEQQAA